MKKKKKTPLRSGVDMSKMTLNQKRSCVNSLKEWTPIEVNWNDCFSRVGWREKREVPDYAMHVKSIGYFLSMDEEFLYNCHDIYYSVSSYVHRLLPVFYILRNISEPAGT